jgi:hypothetical protein
MHTYIHTYIHTLQMNMMSLAAQAKKHTAAEDELAKQNALKEYENKHPEISQNIAKVHKIWSQNHKV